MPFAPIPLPAADNPQFKDVMDYLETIRARQQKAAQFQSEQNRLSSEFNKNYAIQKALADRQAQLFPSQLAEQQAKTKAEQLALAQKEALAKVYQKAFGQQQTNPQAVPTPTVNADQSNMQQAPGATQIQPGGAVPNVTPKPNIGSTPSPNAVAQSTDGTVINPGNPALYAIDAVVGMPGGPQVKRTNPNAAGVYTETYPSGKTIERHTSQYRTPEQVAQNKINIAAGTAKAKSQQKRLDDLLAAVDIGNKYAPNLQTTYELSSQKPWTTGNIAGIRNMLHLANEDQGRFVAASIPLIGQLGKDISSRGGAVVSQLATGAKPAIWTGSEENLGRSKQLIEASIENYNRAKEEWEAITGKPFPKKLHPFLEKYAKSMRPKYSQEQLDKWAAEAQAMGVSQEKIAAKMAQLKGEMNG